MPSDIPRPVTLLARLMQVAVPGLSVVQIALLALFVRPEPYAARDRTQRLIHVYASTTVLVFLIVALAFYSAVWILLGRWIRRGLPLVRLAALVLSVVSVAIAVEVLTVHRSWTTSAPMTALTACHVVIVAILLRPDVRSFSTLGPANLSRPVPDVGGHTGGHGVPSKHRDPPR